MNSGIIIVLVIVFIIFLICRELVCWYWKINALLEECQKTNELLTDTNNILEDILSDIRNSEKKL